MKNRTIKYLACAAVLLGLAATVQANTISGSIGFSGDFTQNGGLSGDLSTANSMTIATTAVGSTTGAFVGATTPVFLSPFAVNANVPSLVGAQMWSVVVGSTTFTMDITSAVQWVTTVDSLGLKGSGTIKDGVAADDTLGTWQVNFGNTGQSFTWQATSANRVPDGGMTVMLLGAALSGLALIRRKLA
jgi:hypothetical protein